MKRSQREKNIDNVAQQIYKPHVTNQTSSIVKHVNTIWITKPGNPNFLNDWPFYGKLFSLFEHYLLIVQVKTTWSLKMYFFGWLHSVRGTPWWYQLPFECVGSRLPTHHFRYHLTKVGIHFRLKGELSCKCRQILLIQLDQIIIETNFMGPHRFE